MLAHSWAEDSGVDPSGYWMAEKLDGVRAYFDGTHFYSRAGNRFFAPPFFSQHLPKDQPLDGELWLGRARFQQCVSIVKNQKADRADEWKEMTYLVFDAPKLDMVYEKRLEYLRSIMPTYGKDRMDTSSSSGSNSNNNKVPPYCRLVPVQKCLSKAHLMRELSHVQNHGGEGIMLRAPRSRYEFKRSKTLLKVKTFFDEEAIVVAQVKGSGKNSHRMGHLQVKTPDGRCFSVGSGFTDAQRERPPKVGAIITYKFQELSNKLIPRFPTFLGERIDI
ncbi:putative ATP-dependent DNA ligase, partial [Lobosporangium transversale]